MSISEEVIAKARKDWENEEIEAVGDFQTYLAGYIACLKRFGGARYYIPFTREDNAEHWRW